MKTVAVLAFAFLLPAAALAANNSSQVMCTALWQPVCAAQTVECFAAPCYPVYHTYSNSCVAENDNARVIHEGECTAAETGPIKPTAPAPYQPPAGCTAWFDGCNSCGMSGNGGAICTLKACVGPAQAGYCTAYAATTTSPAHPVTPVGTATSSATSSATTTASTSADMQAHGFLHRLWHAILAWFE